VNDRPSARLRGRRHPGRDGRRRAGIGAETKRHSEGLSVRSPARMSIHEEATIAAEGPMTGVFNDLVMYRRDLPQAGLRSIVPDLATE
jgi:hypothetical protein